MFVETVDYSVIMNKEMVGPIVPGRGLRQGDTLSPYLFILCAEGLSALIRNAKPRGALQGNSSFFYNTVWIISPETCLYM